MNKVLVSKEKIEKIAEFIDMCACCYGCPMHGKCQRYSDGRGCKDAIIAYLAGSDNCKICWYYMEHKGKVDCTPDNSEACLQNLCDW